jgi:hypothetical protein
MLVSEESLRSEHWVAPPTLNLASEIGTAEDSEVHRGDSPDVLLNHVLGLISLEDIVLSHTLYAPLSLLSETPAVPIRCIGVV